MFFDLTGALVSLLSTYFFIRLNSNAWIVGIVATCLNGWLYWHKGIYADMLLEVFYFMSMCYGWYKWRSNITSNKVPVGNLTTAQWALLTGLLCLVFIVIYSLLQSLTHSTVAFLDATTTSLSLVAQWLMCHKIIVTWVLWFITDALYAFMYLSKNLPFHSILMLVYTGMAITGYIVWFRRMKKEANEAQLSLSPS